ncbi:MAG: hypothetical protein L7W40_02395 [Akkermansiaceae bacterium]|nr:hypothetical protein [Akkermansiaceae bacterium]
MHTKKAIHQFALATITLLGAGYLDVTGAEPEPSKPLTKTPLEENKNKTTKYVAVWNKWQKNIVHFNGMLETLAKTANLPQEDDLKRRIESKSDWLEVITDGYGGVVDFNAAPGTIQYEANKLIGSGGPYIDWEFELPKGAKASWNDSMTLVPKVAVINNDNKEKREQFRFVINIAETDAGPFKAGDRIRLQASIDDFSRFKKGYSKATGLVAIYYLEGNPNPVFDVRLDEAKITRLKSDADKEGKNEKSDLMRERKFK